MSTWIITDELSHHGVKGMKWGVRKQRDTTHDFTVRSKNGDILTLQRQGRGMLAKTIARISPKIKAEQEKTYIYNVMQKGKKVGDLTLYKESKTSMNVVWLSVKNDQRGKGYAQAILTGATKKSKDSGYKQMTLEVPGTSPDARHIYEKQGFVAGKQISSDDDVWGGLTKMKKRI